MIRQNTKAPIPVFLQNTNSDQTLQIGQHFNDFPHSALDAAADLRDAGLDVGVRVINVVKPFDESLLETGSKLIVTIEDNALTGGFGETLRSRACGTCPAVLSYGIPDRFVPHGSVAELRKECGMTAEDIVKGVTGFFERKA